MHGNKLRFFADAQNYEMFPWKELRRAKRRQVYPAASVYSGLFMIINFELSIHGVCGNATTVPWKELRRAKRRQVYPDASVYSKFLG